MCAWNQRIRMLLAVTAFALAAGLLHGCNTPGKKDNKQRAEQHWREVRADIKLRLAQQQYEAREFNRAKITALEAVSLNPASADACWVLVRAQLELGEITEADGVLRSAEQAGLWNHRLAYARALIHEQRRQFEAALEAYRQAAVLAQTPIADYIAAEAECLVRLERPEEALEIVTRHIADFPEDATLMVLAAQVTLLIGDREAAIMYYQQAAVRFELPEQLRIDLGTLLVAERHYGEALAILIPIMQKLERYAADSARPTFAEVATATDTPRESAETIRGTVARLLAACHLELGNPLAAVSVLNSYAYEHPRDIRAQVLMAKASVAAGNLAEAWRYADRAFTAAPEAAEVMFVRALVAWRSNDLNTAAHLLDDLLLRSPLDLEAHCLLGEIFASRGVPEEARRHFRRALEINEQCAWARHALTRLDELH